MIPMSSSSLIAACVDAAYDYQQTPWAQQWKAQMPRETYRTEMKTVVLTLPRGIGHSTAAIHLLHKYPSAQLMYHDYKIAKYTKDKIRDLDHTDISDKRIHVYSMSSRLENQKLVYKDALRNPKQMVIFDTLPPQAMTKLFKLSYERSDRPETIKIHTAFEELIDMLDVHNTDLFVYLQGVGI